MDSIKAHDSIVYGGWNEVALYLTERFGREVSRMQVYAWWRRKAKNTQGEEFPEAHHTAPDRARPRIYQKHLFDLVKVGDWYSTYNPSTGVRKDTIPHVLPRLTKETGKKDN